MLQFSILLLVSSLSLSFAGELRATRKLDSVCGPQQRLVYAIKCQDGTTSLECAPNSVNFCDVGGNIPQWTAAKCEKRGGFDSILLRFSGCYEGGGSICGAKLDPTSSTFDLVPVKSCSTDGEGIISPSGGNVTLADIATITFPDGAYTEDTNVRLITSSSPEINAQFEEFTVMFRPAARLSYEVLVIADGPPLTETVQATLNVPSDFAQALPQDYAIEVFALIQTGDAEEEAFSVFELLEGRVYDAANLTLHFDLPGAAFVEATDGTFVAVVTLAPTPGAGTVRRNRHLQQQQCKGASIRCPVSGGCEVTSEYNLERKHPVTGSVRPHYGTDYRAPVGTPILAAAGGTIERSYMSTSYGNTVIVRHTDGGATLYAHLDSRDVAVGDTVSVGDQLGLSGNTGLSSGPHLHLEYVPNGQIIQSKNRIDPDACIGDVTSGSITAGDNGSAADDSFRLTLNGIDIGTTTIGGQNNLSVNNLIPGSYTLQLTVVVAPDNVGTWFIQLNDGLTFSDGSTFRTGVDGPGVTVTFTVNVPAPP